ncbi:glycosyltransferase [Flavihumibacter profundi]|uniref:glycosyltransferase n=1 Tax=Flavihumibacter profundi TaxID=2716883 RepID=UPI001CC7C23E|nr:glycosyltransferase [Flavihumibacter profundi]MBZ5856231.1 glycosyltransferase [Flavihumibacter profundi]
MSLKIVILGPAHPFRGGGITTFNERLAAELQHEGHQVSILNFTVQYPAFLFPGKSQLTSEPAPEGLTIIRMLHSMNPISWIKTGNYLRHLKPDLVIVRYWLPLVGPAFGTVLRRVKKNGHTKILAITDNVQPHEKRFGDTAFTKYFVGACDAFVCMSEKVLKDLKTFLHQQPVIKLNHPLYDNFGEGIDKNIARQKLGITRDARLLLFFGFIRKYKGLDILLKALKELDDPTVRLLVAGEFYEDAGKYIELVNNLGIGKQVIFKNDFIPNDEVKYYFSAADVVVQPYRNATQSGVTPLAYHFEKPMIVTNVGGLPDYVPDGKTGIVTLPEPVEMAKSIRRFFELGEAHYTANILAEKQKFSWPAFSRSLLDLYKTLVESN